MVTLTAATSAAAFVFIRGSISSLVVYIEHGHQYDQYTSFHYTFHPLDEMERVDLPASHRALYYASGRTDVDTDGTDQNDDRRFFSLGLEKRAERHAGKPRAVVRGNRVSAAVMHRAGLSLKAAVIHDVGVTQTAKATGLPLADVRRIDRMRAVPAQSRARGKFSRCSMPIAFIASGAAAAGIMASFVFMPTCVSVVEKPRSPSPAACAACAFVRVRVSPQLRSDAPKLSTRRREIERAPCACATWCSGTAITWRSISSMRRALRTSTPARFGRRAPEGHSGINHVRLLRNSEGTLEGGLCRVHSGEVITI